MSSGVLVHEWLAKTGGSENVFDAMVDTFPEADLLCLWNDSGDRYPGRELRESWLARTPLRKSKVAALPFMTTAWRNRSDGVYDWALVSSHLFAHHVTFKNASREFKKYVYVHSPARYIWTPELDRRGAGILPRAASPVFKSIDRTRAAEADSIAANSEYVRQRIQHTWGQESQVIYPPVEVKKIQSIRDWRTQLTGEEEGILDTLSHDFLLGAARFIPYKSLDQVIRVGEAAGIPVVLAGSGPEEERLRTIAASARVPVKFIISPSNALLYALYQRTLAYVFPAIEDFGIMPVEAMAAGTAVIVASVGGGSETVVHGVTGAHVDDFRSDDQCRAAIAVATAVDVEETRRRALDFSAERFSSALREWIPSNGQ